MNNEIDNSPIKEYISNIQNDLYEQASNLQTVIESDNFVELTSVLYRWLELRDSFLSCNKIERVINKQCFKTKFIYEVDTEEQLELFNDLFDKMSISDDKNNEIDNYLLVMQSKLIEETEKLLNTIKFGDKKELTIVLNRWVELKDNLSYGIQIKNMLNKDIYITKFGINVNTKRQLTIFNALFNNMRDSLDKEKIFDIFLDSVQYRLICESKDLQNGVKSNDSLKFFDSLYKWLELRDILLFGIRIKNMLNNNINKTRFGIEVYCEEQLDLFNNLFDKMTEYMKANNYFKERKVKM